MSLMFIRKRPSVVFILISTNSYLKPKETISIKSMLFRCSSLFSDFVKFRHEINISKIILYKNSNPRHFVSKCIKEFLDRVLTSKIVVSSVLKKDLIIVLPYLGKLSFQIRTRIDCVMKNELIYFNFRNVFQSESKMTNFSHAKRKYLFSYVLALVIK